MTELKYEQIANGHYQVQVGEAKRTNGEYARLDIFLHNAIPQEGQQDVSDDNLLKLTLFDSNDKFSKPTLKHLGVTKEELIEDPSLLKGKNLVVHNNAQANGYNRFSINFEASDLLNGKGKVDTSKEKKGFFSTGDEVTND